jgi:hypothetical protein
MGYSASNTSPRGPTGYHRNQEVRARAQRKAMRRRHLESVAPRLEILQNMPFFIPFHTRVEIFRQFVHFLGPYELSNLPIVVIIDRYTFFFHLD